MGVHVVRERPRSLEVRLQYGTGAYFNFGRKQFRSRVAWPWSSRASVMSWSQNRAVLTIPRAHLAAVPSARPEKSKAGHLN
jgi:hypothetical protein